MKKMITLLAVLSFIAIAHPLKATTTDGFGYLPIPICNPNEESNQNGYDVKEAARKFRKKHANDPLYEDLIASGNYYIKARKTTIDLIEQYGLEAINENTTTLGHLNPLVVAITEDDKPLIKFLLQHGAKLNEPIKHYYPTAHGVLHETYYPIECVSSTEMLQYLQENGADLSPLFNDLDSSEIKNVPGLREYLEKNKTQ